MIPVTASIALHPDELRMSFIRASGPGGQNVNKVSTAVQLRFDLLNSPSLPPALKARAARLAGSRLTAEGEIVLTADRFRTQLANRRDALDRLVALLAEASVAPKKRRPTRPGAGARARRMDTKKHRGDVKSGRGKPGLD